MTDRPAILVLHLDESLVAVSKPGGLLVHRSEEASDRVFLLQDLKNQLGRTLYPVHRLDRAASGVIVFAFSSAGARALQASLNSGDAHKQYLVLVRGSAPDAFEVDHPLKDDRGVSRPARTAFRKLAELFRLSLLEARIFTGRRHQIRRHLARSAHQVLGDSTYGKGRINQFFRQEYGLPRLFLHASRLVLRHPLTGEPLVIFAPLPDDLREFLRRLPSCPGELLGTL